MGIENPVHLIFIGIVALLVLGPKRLPELARALGHGIREFRQAVNSGGEELHAPLADPAVSQTPIAQPVLEPPSHTPLAQAHEHTVESTAEEEPDPASPPAPARGAAPGGGAAGGGAPPPPPRAGWPGGSRYGRAMRLIVARCEVSYAGRLSTVLPEAVRLLMLKADGTFMVWADGGGPNVKPLNCMIPPTVVEEETGERGALTRLIVRKQRQQEQLDIAISEVLSDV